MSNIDPESVVPLIEEQEVTDANEAEVVASMLREEREAAWIAENREALMRERLGYSDGY